MTRSNRNPIPTQHIHVQIGGYGGPFYELELKASGLFYQASSDGYFHEKPLLVHPAADAYARFWLAIDAMGAWRWRDEYCDRDIVDGTSWSVELRKGPLKLTSSGNNAYPRKFREFLKAVQSLIGGLPFA